ncbi:MAG: hypothetical protein LQ339_000665 [Xanthoria mediterranea]|nr:MAG: hypothetical protein LQ339_000665 [Xanthoria mediterranea]
MGQAFDQPIDVIYKQSIQGPKDWANLMATARKQISDSSSSGARRPELVGTIREQEDTFSDTISDTVARPLPVTIGSKEVDPQAPNITEKRFMNSQDHMPSEGQTTRSSIQTSPWGNNTIMSVSRQSFHLYYWLSAAPALSTRPVILEKEKPSAATNSVPEHNTTTFDVDSTKINKYIIELTVHMEQLSNPASTEKTFNSETRRYPNPEAEGMRCILDYASRYDLKDKLCAIAEDLQYGPHPGTISLPDEFRQVGHPLIAIFLEGTCAKPRKKLSFRFLKCRSLLLDGRRKLLQSMAPEGLETMEAVLPVGLVALLINKVVKDITDNAPDIVSTYYDYMLRLEQDIQKRPHRRLHQEKLSSFRQETNCIIRVLEDQIGVVNQLQQMLGKGGVISLILGRRREDFILGECLTTLEDRVSNFSSLERHARDLASFNLLRIESSKDRQEAAILVFTIVTIIFLPLSFVSSFFGMNTTDIRDTKFPQWIFWVSAVPLTVLVVILSLFVAQQLEPLKDLWGRVQDRWIALAHRESRVEYYTHRRPTGDLQADGEDEERPNLPASRVRNSEESNGT